MNRLPQFVKISHHFHGQVVRWCSSGVVRGALDFHFTVYAICWLTRWLSLPSWSCSDGSCSGCFLGLPLCFLVPPLRSGISGPFFCGYYHLYFMHRMALVFCVLLDSNCTDSWLHFEYPRVHQGGNEWEFRLWGPDHRSKGFFPPYRAITFNYGRNKPLVGPVEWVSKPIKRKHLKFSEQHFGNKMVIESEISENKNMHIC